MAPMLTLPSTHAILDRRSHATRQALLVRVRGEFKEMPCLRLTGEQARRLFGLTPDVCDRVLATLVKEGVLARGSDERYSAVDAFQRGVP